MDLNFVSVCKNVKKGLGQYPAFLTLHLVFVKKAYTGISSIEKEKQ